MLNNLPAIYITSLKHPKILCTVFCAVVLLSLCQFPNLLVNLTPGGLVDSPSSERFNHDPNAVFGVYANLDQTPLSKEQICSIKFTLHHSSLPWVKNIFSAFDLVHFEKKEGQLLSKPLVPADCLSEKSVTLDSLKHTQWSNLLSTPSGSDFLFALSLQKESGIKDGSSQDTSLVTKLKELVQALEKSKPANMTFHIYGLLPIKLHLYEAIKKDIVLNGILLITLFILYWIIFRSVFGATLFISSFLLTGIIVLGLMALFGHPMDLLTTSGMFILTCVATLEDFIFVAWLSRSTKNLLSPFQKLIVPSFFTSLTTAIGVGSLTISDWQTLRHFGLWSAVGAMLEWLITFTFVPSIVHLTRRKISYEIRFPIWLEKIAQIQPRAAFGVISMVAVAAIAVLSVSKGLKTGESIEDFFPKSHPLIQSIDYFHQSRGWKSYFDVVIPQTKTDQEIDKLVSKFELVPGVSQVQNPIRIVTELGMRQIESDEISLRKNIYLLPLFDQFFSPNAVRIPIFLKSRAVEDTARVVSEFEHLCQNDQCSPVGGLVSYARYFNVTTKTLFESLGLSLVIVIALLLLLALKRAPGQISSIIISSVWGPLIMLGIFILFDLHLNFVTCTFTCVLVGLSGDNAIQYLFVDPKGRVREGAKQRAMGSLLVAFFMIVGSLVFFWSSFKAVQTLGILFGVGALVILLGDLFVLRSLLTILKK